MSNLLTQVQNNATKYRQSIQDALIVDNLFKYLVLGVAIALVAYVIPSRKTSFKEILIISVLGALSFFILDLFDTEVGKGARLGAGAGIGYALVSNASTVIPFM
jgi:hypothetical protein